MAATIGSDGFDRVQLSGTEGLLRNDSLLIRLGETVVVGRSRSCDFSTRRSKRFLAASEVEQRRILEERSFNKVSRQHTRISFLAKGQVEICDLSRNGTFIDDMRILDKKLLQDLDSLGVEIRLADSERMRLRPLPTDSATTADEA